MFTFIQDNQKWKAVNKNKMDNPTFADEEDIPMVHQDDDYDDYNTSGTGRVERLFKVPDTADATSNLR